MPLQPVVINNEVLPKIAPSLTFPCEDFQTSEDASLQTILFTHVGNMEKAHKCRARYNALRREIKRLEDNSSEAR